MQISNPLFTQIVYLIIICINTRKLISNAMSTNKQKQSKSLLSRLRTVVQKVRILLSSTVLSRTWHAVSVIRRASFSKRHLSFGDSPPGLIQICSNSDETEDSEGNSGTPSPCLQRTISFPSDDDDIDRRSEIFIANFRRQLRMERQISMQLRYQREHSLEPKSP